MLKYLFIEVHVFDFVDYRDADYMVRTSNFPYSIQLISSISVSSQLLCMVECRSEFRCQAFNFIQDTVPPMCELLEIGQANTYTPDGEFFAETFNH